MNIFWIATKLPLMYCSILLIELPGFSLVSIFAMVSISSYPAAWKHLTMYSGSFFFISDSAGFSHTDSGELQILHCIEIYLKCYSIYVINCIANPNALVTSYSLTYLEKNPSFYFPIY